MNKNYIAPSIRTTFIATAALMSGSTQTMTIGNNNEQHEHDAESKRTFMDYGFNDDND